jgi:putative ABC transport system permease protein
MLFGEAIRIALQSLRANKLRSLLTVLGILIGVSSVIAVVAITEGLDAYMSDKVLELGTKAFRLQSRPDIINSHEMWLEMMKRKRLNMDDYVAVQKACTLCSEVGAQVWTGTNVKRGRIIQKNVGVAGITENIARIGTIRELVAGRHIVQQDVSQAAMVGVIGTDLVDAFFGMMEPIGKEIDIDGHPIKVIGVAEKKGAVFGESQDNFVWLPITTFQKFYGTRRSFSIQAEARTMAVFEAAQDQVRVTMRARRHLTYNKADNFNIETGETVMELWQTMTRGIYVVTFVVTTISLLWAASWS